MGGYPGFAGHPWHHYLAGGPASLLALSVLPLGLLLLVGACSAGRRVANLVERRRSSAGPAQGGARSTRAVRAILASDAERDETARRVSHAIGEGRLSIDEGGERIDAVLRARHRHELARLVADLPALAPARPAQLAAASARSALLLGASAVVAAAVLLQVIAGMWELWPVAVVALGTVALLPRR
jgi:hypothetical protein